MKYSPLSFFWHRESADAKKEEDEEKPKNSAEQIIREKGGKFHVGRRPNNDVQR